MMDQFMMLTLKIPIKFYNKLEAIASANNKSINDTALEMIHEKIRAAESKHKKEIVTVMLKDQGGEIVKA
ncbi:MAG: hypothetical protein U9N83_12100 [Thermodesulfobacteriota bacterium]|nr:hypothetical protein [Thermodesulfobacteriota bacterium]